MPAEKTHRVADVYGISRDLPLNYVERKTVDEKLLDSLTREKHLVIYGSSKQGKTSLRKHCLNDSDYVVVHCSNRWGVGDINSAILKSSGYEVTQSNTKTTSGKNKILASLGSLWLGGSANAEFGHEREKTESNTTSPLELDPEDVNDIIRALGQASFSKFVVLEDFHYLTTETQKDFAVSLKAFHEQSKLCFIIIGVWLEENRLTVYNGDLTGRVIAIDADEWTSNELRQVISDGEALLNISFSESFKENLLKECFGSVHIVQETCYLACDKSGVVSTKDKNIDIGYNLDVRELVKNVVNQQTGRYNSGSGPPSTDSSTLKIVADQEQMQANEVHVFGLGEG